MDMERYNQEKERFEKIISAINVEKLPAFCGLDDKWSAFEEIVLLTSVEIISHGNWTLLAEVLTKNFKKNFTPEEVCDHYNNTYLEGDIAEALKDAYSDIFRCSVTDHTFEEDDEILKRVDMNAYKNVPPECLKEIGYMPLREDFKVEYQPNTEDLIQHLTFSNVDEYDKNVNLILLDLYRTKIEQRIDMKTAVKKHRLVEKYFSSGKPCTNEFLVSSLLYSKSNFEILHILLQNFSKNDVNEVPSKRKTRSRLKKYSVRKNREKIVPSVSASDEEETTSPQKYRRSRRKLHFMPSRKFSERIQDKYMKKVQLKINYVHSSDLKEAEKKLCKALRVKPLSYINYKNFLKSVDEERIKNTEKDRFVDCDIIAEDLTVAQCAKIISFLEKDRFLKTKNLLILADG